MVIYDEATCNGHDALAHDLKYVERWPKDADKRGTNIGALIISYNRVPRVPLKGSIRVTIRGSIRVR